MASRKESGADFTGAASCALALHVVKMLRHPVGKTTLEGYLQVRPRDEAFFGSEAGKEIEIGFGEGGAVLARLVRSGDRLKVAYTGEAGAPFRRWLKATFKTRKPRGPRGVLVLLPAGPDRYQAQTESLRQAQVDELELKERHFLQGAKPVSVLHPAMTDLVDIVRRVVLPPPVPAGFVRERIERELRESGWQPGGSVGGGLLLEAGLRRSGAELHAVLEPADLYRALLSLAAGFELHQIELGVLLVADGPLASRLRQAAPQTSLERVMREIGLLPFLVRGPVAVMSLGLKRRLR